MVALLAANHCDLFQIPVSCWLTEAYARQLFQSSLEILFVNWVLVQQAFAGAKVCAKREVKHSSGSRWYKSELKFIHPIMLCLNCELLQLLEMYVLADGHVRSGCWIGILRHIGTSPHFHGFCLFGLLRRELMLNFCQSSMK